METIKLLKKEIFVFKGREGDKTGRRTVEEEAGESAHADLMETILLAEDNPDVRWFTKTILEEYYYTVIEAVDGEDAIKKYMENRDSIDLLIFDVLMPRKDGKEAFYEIKTIRPDVKVLFTSGGNDIMEDMNRDASFSFIPKPFSPAEFLKKVREVISGSKDIKKDFKTP